MSFNWGIETIEAFTDSCYLAVIVWVERCRQVESENRYGKCEVNLTHTQAGMASITHDSLNQPRQKVQSAMISTVHYGKRSGVLYR